MKEIKGVAKFLQEVIYRFKIFNSLIINRGRKFIEEVTKILKKYKVKYIIVSAYYSKVNSIIKRGHRPIINALAKLLAAEKGN